MEIIKSLAILFILMLLGYISRQFGVFEKEDIKRFNSFLFFFSLPALFIVKIARMELMTIDPGLILGSILPIFAIVGILLVWHAAGFLSKDRFILLSLSIVFGSNSFFGLAFYEFFQDGLYYDTAVLAASMLGGVGIFLSLLLFEYAKNELAFKPIWRSLSRNPLLLSIFFGVVLSVIGFRESFLHHPFEVLGDSAGAIAVFTLGIFLYDNFSLKIFKKAIGYVLFRFTALPLAALVVIYLLRVDHQLSVFLFLQTAIPAAVSLAVLSHRYQYKEKTITGLVIFSSLFSFLFLLINYYLANYFF